MWETQVWSLGREDLLEKEKEMATHSSTLAWKIPWREKPGRLQSMGSQRVGQDWATSLSLSIRIHVKHTKKQFILFSCLWVRSYEKFQVILLIYILLSVWLIMVVETVIESIIKIVLGFCLFDPITVITHYQSFSSVQSLSRFWLFATPWTAACQASIVTVVHPVVHHQLSELAQTHVHGVGDSIFKINWIIIVPHLKINNIYKHEFG